MPAHIFRHRVNNLKDFEEIKYPIELDFRTLIGEVVVGHDIQTLEHGFDTGIPVLQHISKLKNTVIANIKESGIEDKLIPLFDFYGTDYYFLDSQIPDIVRLSKKWPRLHGRFILRVSDIEDIPWKLIDFCRPKYLWIDYSKFDNFDKDEYSNFLNLTLWQIKNTGAHPIIVSPELYGEDKTNITSEVVDVLKYKDRMSYSVCTKLPRLYA